MGHSLSRQLKMGDHHPWPDRLRRRDGTSADAHGEDHTEAGAPNLHVLDSIPNDASLQATTSPDPRVPPVGPPRAPQPTQSSPSPIAEPGAKYGLYAPPSGKIPQSGGAPTVQMFHGAHGFQINDGTFIAAGPNSTVTNNITNIYNQKEQSGLLVTILEWLPSNNFRAIQIDTFAKRTLDTGLWFTASESFRMWFFSQGGVFWGIGMRGAGKTVLVSIVINLLQGVADNQPNVSFAYAYCRYSDPLSVRDILASLVRQQLERHPFLLDCLPQSFLRHQREGTQPSQAELLTVLKAFAQRFDKTFYALDGLDESLDDAQFDLLETLASVRVNFLLTSRPFKVEILRAALPEAVLVEIVAQGQDIELYVNERIDKNPAFRLLLEKHNMREETVTTIREHARGMFLHAQLQFEAIRHCFNLKDLREKLEQAPAKLEYMYRDTVKRIEKQPAEHAQLAKWILIWLIYARRSLSVGELQAAMAITPTTHEYDAASAPHEAFLSSVCCGLITVDKESGLVRLVHYTARDVLKSILAEFCPRPNAALQAACIGRLVACNFTNGADFINTKTDLRKAFSSNPLLSYAYESIVPLTKEALESESAPLEASLDFVRRCHSLPYVTGAERLRWSSPPELEDLHRLLDSSDPFDIDGDDEPIVDEAYDAIMAEARANLADVLSFEDLFPASPPKEDPEDVARDVHVQLKADSEGTIPNDVARSGPPPLDWLRPIHFAALCGSIRLFQATLVADRGGVAEEIVNTPTPALQLTPCMLSARHGNISLVQWFMESDFSQCLGARDRLGRTAFLWAYAGGLRKVVEILLASPDTDVNQRDAEGATSLILATDANAPDTVETLLAQAGIDANARQSAGGFTALMLAASGGSLAIVKLLMKFRGILVEEASAEGKTALIQAAIMGNEDIVSAMVELGADPNAPDTAERYRWTPLMWGASYCNEDVVRVLLKVPDVDVNYTSPRGWTALAVAADDSMAEEGLWNALLDVPGIEINTANERQETALMHAAKRGRMSLVKRMLAMPGIEVHRVNEEGRTALSIAAGAKHDDSADEGESVLPLLVAFSDSDVNSVDGSGWTPLIWAAYNGAEANVRFLVQLPSVDVNHIADGGFTALMWSVAQKRIGCTRALLGVPGIKINCASWRGETALMLAALREDEEATQMLLDQPDCDVNCQDRDGVTALMKACWAGHAGVVRMLLKHPEIGLNIGDEDGETALMGAVSRDHEEIAHMLLDDPTISVDAKDFWDETVLTKASEKGMKDIVRRVLLKMSGRDSARNPSDSGRQLSSV